MNRKDYYNILGIEDGVADVDIKKAYRRLAFEYHPDRNLGDTKAAEEKFKEITEAYEILSDPIKRRQYNQFRKFIFNRRVSSGFSQEDAIRTAYWQYRDVNDFHGQTQQSTRYDRRFFGSLFGQKIFETIFGASNRRQTDRHKKSPFANNARNNDGFSQSYYGDTAWKSQQSSIEQNGLDLHWYNFILTSDKADIGMDGLIRYQSGSETKQLVIRIPPNVQTGTSVRYKGMGLERGGAWGDLYLHIRVT